MKIHAIQCSNCYDIIYSRARHDFHKCSCQKTFVDGGFAYMRCGYDENYRPIHKDLELSVTEKELYDDWNLRQDNYGLIKYPANNISASTEQPLAAKEAL